MFYLLSFRCIGCVFAIFTEADKLFPHLQGLC